MAPVRQIYPFAREIEVHETYRDVDFPVRPDRPYMVLNFVMSVDGRVAVNGRAGSLGSVVDRELMRQIRGGADALLIGAGTLRAEAIDPRVPPEIAERRKSAGRSPQPLFVLITASGKVPDRKLFHMAEVPRLVLGSRTAKLGWLQETDPEAEVETFDQGWVDLSDAFRYLRSRGIRSVVCEGGPTLAGDLAARGLVDELFLTVAPKIVGGAGPRVLEGVLAITPQESRLDLVSVHENEGELFLRYRLEPREGHS